MDPNKLANVRGDILKKNRLKSGETEEIKRTAAREPRNSEKRNPADASLRTERITPEQIKNTV